MLYIEPIGGLCNRLRAVNSAVNLGRDLGQKTMVLWNAKNELNCCYNSLFMPSDEFVVVEGRGRVAPLYLLKRYMGASYFKEEKIGRIKEDAEAVLSICRKKEGNIYFRTGYQFYRTSSYPELFRPVYDIAGKVKALQGKWTGHMIGVHIRRTDNKKAIESSGLEDFMRAMEREMEEDFSVGFYLATDSASVQRTLQERFGSRIYFQENVQLTRSSQEGIKSALVDLLCLAGTSKILGSYWSSFSDAAAQWYEIPLEIIRSKKVGE